MYQVISTLKSLEFVRCCVSANDMTNCACPLIGTVPKCCLFEERTGASRDRFAAAGIHPTRGLEILACKLVEPTREFLHLPLLFQKKNRAKNEPNSRLTDRIRQFTRQNRLHWLFSSVWQAIRGRSGPPGNQNAFRHGAIGLSVFRSCARRKIARLCCSWVNAAIARKVSDRRMAL